MDGIERIGTRSRWAVIKDARRRQRRRHRRSLTIATLTVAAVAGGWAIGSSVALDHAPIAAVGAVEQVKPGGIIEGTASVRGDLWVLSCRYHCSDVLSSKVRGWLVELTAAGRAIRRLSVADPGAVGGGDGSIWLTHYYSGEITRIDPQTGQTTATLHLQFAKPIASGSWSRFEPLGISFGAGRLWVSSPFGYVAEINPRTAQLTRMVFTSSEVTSATTAAGKTWVADELDGVGTFTAGSRKVVTHQVSWAGEPVDVQTVAYGSGLIWALGTETSLTGPATASVVTTINPHTGGVVHQWRVAVTATMVLAHGGAYVGDDRDGRLLRLIPPNRTQILHGPKSASLTAATGQTLWATTPAGPLALAGPVKPTRLLRIALTQH